MNIPVAGHVMSTPSSAEAIEWLPADDGHRIPLRHWPLPSPRAVVHIVHGMAEHSGCYADVAPAFNALGYAVFAHDHRCHGLATSANALGCIGHRQHWAGVCADMAVVNAEISRRYPDTPIAVLGHSMGSFISQRFAQEHPERVNLLMLEGSSYQAPWFTFLAGLLGSFEAWRQGNLGRSALIHALSFGGFNRAFKPARTDFDWLSRDTGFVDRYLADPLCGFRLCNGYWRDFVKGLNALYRPTAMRRIRGDLSVYLFAGDRDPVGHSGRSVERLARCYRETVGCRDVTLRLYPEARHDVLHELNGDEVVSDLLGWLGRHVPERRKLPR